MYFYIARGIELLAEGERRNQRSPDMRYQIAFYYQNKFGVVRPGGRRCGACSSYRASRQPSGTRTNSPTP